MKERQLFAARCPTAASPFSTHAVGIARINEWQILGDPQGYHNYCNVGGSWRARHSPADGTSRATTADAATGSTTCPACHTARRRARRRCSDQSGSPGRGVPPGDRAALAQLHLALRSTAAQRLPTCRWRTEQGDKRSSRKGRRTRRRGARLTRASGDGSPARIEWPKTCRCFIHTRAAHQTLVA